MPRIALVSNELPPYRIPFFQALAKLPDVELQVLLCSKREPNRHWELPQLDFGHQFLRERILRVGNRYIHNNPGVLPALQHFAPDVIVTGGFNPTHLYAFTYALCKARPHVAMTDGTDLSESGLSGIHRAVRRFVYARTRAFAAASDGGMRLFSSYQVPALACFKVPLCVDNLVFAPKPEDPMREIDLLFCGRYEDVKNPLFALEVALATARRLRRRVRIDFVGAGEQEEQLRAFADREQVLLDVRFHGFLAHDDLPKLYRSANVFLFPSRWDPWGVVANEACAAGLPVVVSPFAGVANELVVDGRNGFVCELDVEEWAERCALLLDQPAVWDRFSRRSLEAVRDYTYDIAAQGMRDACAYALMQSTPTSFPQTEMTTLSTRRTETITKSNSRRAAAENRS